MRRWICGSAIRDRESCERSGDPLVRHCFVISVTVGARVNTFGAKSTEPFVEFFPGAAKIRIITVAQREDGERETVQARGGLILERSPQSGGIIWRIAVAPRARHKEKSFCFGQLRN